MKEFPRLSAGVKYQEFEMKDDESPPRSAEESATRTISARLLSGPLTLGEGPSPVFLGEISKLKECSIFVEVLVVASSPVSNGGRNGGGPPKLSC